MPNTYTPNLVLAKPGDGDTGWGDEIRGDLDIIDALFPGGQAAIADGSIPLAKLDTDVATKAELDGHALVAATTSAAGHVELATNGESVAGVVVQGDDARLSNARAPTAHSHGKSDLPTAIAYEDEANTFAQTQALSGGATLGMTTAADVRTTGMYLPRGKNLSDAIMLDYQDELALFTRKAGRVATVTPTPSSGVIASAFEDNSASVAYSPGTSPYPVVIEMDALSNPILANAGSQYRLALTLRNSGNAGGYPTSYTLENWVSGAYVVVQSGALTIVSDIALLPQFASAASGSNVQKLRLTLNGTNPLVAGDTLRIQRVILYHITADWDPWHLHRLTGGEVYGPVTLSGGVAGIPRDLSWYYDLTVAAVTAYGPLRRISAATTILGAYAIAKTAPAGTPLDFDIQWSANGSTGWASIFSARPTIAAGAVASTAGTLSKTTFAAGDYVRLNIVSPGGTPAQSVTFDLVMSTR